MVQAAQKRFGVASKGAIIKNDKLLIIYKTAEEAQSDPEPSFRRDLPGGRVQFGETPIDTLHREILEEVGLRIEVIAPVYVWQYVKEDFQLIGITWFCKWVEGEVTLGSEHEDFEWLKETDIIAKHWTKAEEYYACFDYYRKSIRNSL